MGLEQLLGEIKQRRLMLTYNKRGRVVLWDCHQYVPMLIRQAIHSHSQELHRLIRESDIRTCAASDLHRQEWDYRSGRYICAACSRLLAEVSA